VAARRSPLVLVFEDLHWSSDSLLDLVRNYVAMSLEPLNDDAVARLVCHMVGSSAPQIAERVVVRAEGNPFFAGEIVQSIRERVRSLSDDVAVEQTLATLPDTIQATILARLDLLPPEERRVLQLGAVFGRAFRADGIAALGPELASDIDTLLDRLVRKDLIRPLAGDSFVFPPHPDPEGGLSDAAPHRTSQPARGRRARAARRRAGGRSGRADRLSLP
jgi:predicted ATPase